MRLVSLLGNQLKRSSWDSIVECFDLLDAYTSPSSCVRHCILYSLYIATAVAMPFRSLAASPSPFPTLRTRVVRHQLCAREREGSAAGHRLSTTRHCAAPAEQGLPAEQGCPACPAGHPCLLGTCRGSGACAEAGGGLADAPMCCAARRAQGAVPCCGCSPRLLPLLLLLLMPLLMAPAAACHLRPPAAAGCVRLCEAA